MTSLETWRPQIRSIARIVAALLFLEFGFDKFFDFPGPAPEMSPLLWVQGVIEIVGGTLLLIGAYTRPVAFILSGDMAAAYFIEHFPQSFFPSVNGGGEAIMFCFFFLYLACAGGGPWSVDEAVLKRS